MHNKMPQLLSQEHTSVIWWTLEVPKTRVIKVNTLYFARDHLILAVNILFTFIYELIGQDLKDNVYFNIHLFPLSPLQAMISLNH